MTDEIPVTKSETVKSARSGVAAAIAEGAADARESAQEIVPVIADSATRAMYGTCYYAAYFATFTALTLMRLIPTDSVVARGLHDGAGAAAGDYEAHKAQQTRLAAAEVNTGGGNG